MKSFPVRALVASVAGLFLLSACGGGGEVPPSAFPGMTTDGQSAYLASNAVVYKFNAQNASESWRFTTSTEKDNQRGPFSGVPTKIGDVVVAGGSTGANGAYDKHLYGISDENGQEVWRFTPPGDKGREFVDGAVTDGKIIYAPNGDGNLYAIDPAQKDSNQPKAVWTFNTGNRLWSKPLLADGKLYQGALDHKLYAIDAVTGKELWRFEGATAPIAVQPTLKDGVLYCGAFDSVFYAVNAKDGSLKWKTVVDGWVWTAAAITSDGVYFGDVKGKLYALDLASGQRNWTFETRDSIKAQPVISGTTMYVVSVDTNVYAFDLKDIKKDAAGVVEFNNSKWRNETIGRRLLSSPVVMGDVLLIPVFDGDVKVWALDANTGSRKYQFPIPPAATPTPGK
ncbi:MAG TPA: PQQ-binding-like beta-propeller repeat protein [Anaerolineae bacterium]